MSDWKVATEMMTDAAPQPNRAKRDSEIVTLMRNVLEISDAGPTIAIGLNCIRNGVCTLYCHVLPCFRWYWVVLHAKVLRAGHLWQIRTSLTKIFVTIKITSRANPAFDPTDDCCYNSFPGHKHCWDFLNISPVVAERCNGGDSCCSLANPCLDGEGDCDRDSDCEGILVCGVDNCGRNDSGFDPKDDCCYNPIPGFKHLLYFQNC